MTTTESSLRVSSSTGELSAIQKTANDFDKIARLVVTKHASSASMSSAAEVANVARLLADFPDLLNRLEVQTASETESVAKPTAQPLSSEQVVNMARLHFATQAGIASSQHAKSEINRFLSENGIF